MSKLDELRNLAIGRGNRHLNIAADHYAIVSRIDLASIPRTKRRAQHRTNAARMQYVEAAAQCLQACSTALDSEILVFALSIRSKIVPKPRQDAFTDLFAKKVNKQTAPLHPGKPFKSLGAWDLHRLAENLCKERKVRPPWPRNAYKKIADPRNAIVHQSNYLVRRGSGPMLIRLLEDEDPRRLRKQVEDSTECLIACFAALNGLRAVKSRWAKIDVAKL